MVRRRALALGIAGVMLLGVASATSLGQLNGLSFWATTMDQTDADATNDFVCEVADGTADTTFYTGLLGSLTELSLLDLILSSDVTYIELTNLTGGCEGLRPVVVVIGEPSLLTTDREVLSRTLLDPLTSTDVTTGSVLLPVDPVSEINSLLSLSTATPDEVRVAFCRDGVTACEPSP